MVRTQVQLTEAQVRAVKALARDNDISVAEVVRNAVDSYLEQGEDDALRRRAIAAIGGFRSGQGSVSERHDDHIVAAFAR